MRAGLIGSPNWPYSYNDASNFDDNRCTWDITVSDAKNVAVYVIDLNLARRRDASSYYSCPNTRSDYLSIRYKSMSYIIVL